MTLFGPLEGRFGGATGRGLLLVLCLGASAGGADAAPRRVALLPAANLKGAGSGRALDQAVRQALLKAHVPLASQADVARAAKAARVKVKAGLSAALAARLVARGPFAAAVIFRRGGAGPFAQLIDRQATVLVERRVSAASATNFATAAAAQLGVDTPAAPEPAPSSPDASAPPPDLAPIAPPPPPPPVAAPTTSSAPAPSGEPTEAASVYAGPEASGPTAGRASEPVLRFGAFAGAGTRLFLVPPPSSFKYRTGTPYPMAGFEVELFPFANFGLGLVADVGLGIVRDQVENLPGTFTSQDLQVDGLLAYRFHLFGGPFATGLTLEAGAGLRNFDAPSDQNIAADNRFLIEAGLAVGQPLVPRYLRIAASALALPVAKLRGAGQGAYGASSTFGLRWSAGLEGDLFWGFEWALSVAQERFWDSYSSPSSQSGVEVDTLYGGHLRFRL